MTSSRAGELGAPLSEAESLYKDLQNVYADTQQQNIRVIEHDITLASPSPVAAAGLQNIIYYCSCT